MRYEFYKTTVKVINAEGKGLLSETKLYFKSREAAAECLKKQEGFAKQLGIPHNNLKTDIERVVIDTEDENEDSNNAPQSAF